MLFSCVMTADEECDAGLDGNECCTSKCKKKILTGTCYKGIKSYRGLLSGSNEKQNCRTAEQSNTPEGLQLTTHKS